MSDSTGFLRRRQMEKQVEQRWKPTNKRESDFGTFMKIWLWGIAGLIAAALLVFALDAVLGCFR